MAATPAPTHEAPTDRRRERHLAKRAAIVDEAWKLARRDGLAAISLRDLADQVGLRQPSLYAYFDSKLALYDAMFADGNQQLIESVSELPSRDDPNEALVEFVETMTRFSADDTVRHQLLFQRTIPGFEPSPASYAVAERFFEIGRERLAAAGITELDDVDLFTAVVSGLAHQQVANDPGGDRWVRQARRAVDMFLVEVTRDGDTGPAPTPKKSGAGRTSATSEKSTPAKRSRKAPR